MAVDVARVIRVYRAREAIGEGPNVRGSREGMGYRGIDDSEVVPAGPVLH